MSDFNISVPVYLINGILESGKTSFLNFTIRQDYFQIDDLTLLITCEEGEETFDEKELLKYNTVLEIIENPSDFTFEYLRTLHRKYHPDRVLLEYNPLWGTQTLRGMKLPLGWGISQEIVLVDGSSYQIYRNNMQSVFSEMVRNADMVIFNRCKANDPLTDYRRGLKVVNPSCEISFENDEGELIDLFEDSVPYDMDASPIEIADMDYGIWYMDALDDPRKYEGKKVRFLALVYRPNKMKKGVMIPGRFAMTCCVDDITFVGFKCKYANAASISHRSWITITAEMKTEFALEYKGKGPVLYALDVQPAEKPADELIYFS